MFFLITHVTSVAAPFLYDPILNDPGYIAGAGPNTRVLVGRVDDEQETRIDGG